MTNRSLTHHKSIAIACAILLVAYATIAWLAVQSKGPAYDEPYHALSAWVQLHYHDFRIDDEDPPLWQYWASLPNSSSTLKADFNSDVWKAIPNSVAKQWYWGVQTLYRTAGNDPVRLIARCRAMMLSLAVVLGVLICIWAWRIGGPMAAVVATSLFCLDPNFLAHGPLMKNDVAFTLSMFSLAFVLWKAGQRLTFARLSWMAVLCVVTLTVKFSGFIAVLLVPLLLGWRAMLPEAWQVLGRHFTTRWNRLRVTTGVTVICMIVSYAGIWAVYGFRYRPTPLANVSLNLNELNGEIRYQAMMARYRGDPPPNTGPDKTLPIPAQFAMFAHRHGLLPEAFVAGFLFTYATALMRFAYANGHVSIVGWWWYFPFAILVKTPVATLLAMFVAAMISIRRFFTRVKSPSPGLRSSLTAMPATHLKHRTLSWTAICLIVPIALFLGSAMSSNLNIGIRHVLAIYPFVFVIVGVTIARLWTSRGIKTRIAISVLGVMLAIETLSAFPNYIAFFNSIATNATDGKIALLGDSNLDWGQDLPLLAKWQTAHPNEKLYLCYFGYADPRYYGICYVPMPGGYRYDTPPHFPEEHPEQRCVVAISASNLQAFLLDAKLQNYYHRWAMRKPIAVLGDTIYLYEFDAMENGGSVRVPRF